MAENGKLQEGDTFVSSPGRLPFKKIIHAVGPTWYNGCHHEKTLLQSTVRSVLQEVCSQSLELVAILCISAGIFRYPVREAADVIVRTVVDFCNGTNNLKCVYLVDKSSQVVKAFKSVLQQQLFTDMGRMGVEQSYLMQGTLCPTYFCLYVYMKYSDQVRNKPNSIPRM